MRIFAPAALLVFVLSIVSAQTSYNVSLFGNANKYGVNPLASNYSEVWGWTDSVSGREYAFIGTKSGTSVVDLSTSKLSEASFIIGPPSGYNYHEFRTYKNYLFIGAEGTDVSKNAGVQIVDLSPLPDSTSVKKIYVWADTNTSNNLVKKYYRAHTVSIDKHFLYVHGGDFGGTKILDVSDPLNPLQVGSYGKGLTPYVHDAYIRNDTLYAAAIYAGRVDIVDMTQKGYYTQNTSGKIVAKVPTVPEGRTHQVWLSDDGNTMFVSTEIAGGVLHIYDISDRTNPIQISTWASNTSKSIHNSFVKGDFIYIAYYTEGFRVLDVSDPATPIEVAFYQTYQTLDTNPPLYAGAWGVYPYFPSGKVAVSDMNTGLYILTVNEKKGGRVTGVVTDASTSQVIPDVIVTVEEMGRTHRTDASGMFLYGSAEGKHTVTFSKSGYITRVETVYTRAAMLDTIQISLSAGTGTSVINQLHAAPAAFNLSQNYPNPFNPSTRISFSVNTELNTQLKIFNALGQELSTLVDQSLSPGTYSVTFDASSLTSGIYFYSLISGNNRTTRKMVLSK